MKQASTHVRAAHRIDGARIGQVELPGGPGACALEDVVLVLTDLLPDRVGPGRPIDHDQLFRLSDRQLSDHEAVENREQGGVGTDPERK